MAVRWVLPVLFLSAFALAAPSPAYSAGEARRLPPTNAEMVFVPGGDWSIGCAPSDSECFADERPRTTAPGRAGFWLDATEVTAGQYRRYVQATGAKPPAAVGFAVGDDEPVVNVSWGEAVAFCTWADKRLPTEIEWETAARGTLSDATFSAGAAIDHDRANLAGTGGRDRWAKLAPVGSFERNSIGIFDMAGNVWEWTSDWFAARHPADAAKACCVPKNPRGGPIEGSYEPRQPNVRIPRKVVKGGSFLCSPSYCLRYRPAARQPQMIDSAMSHIGFRCIDRNRRAP